MSPRTSVSPSVVRPAHAFADLSARSRASMPGASTSVSRQPASSSSGAMTRPRSTMSRAPLALPRPASTTTSAARSRCCTRLSATAWMPSRPRSSRRCAGSATRKNASGNPPAPPSLATCHDGHVTQLTDELQALPPALRKKIERRKREYLDLVRNTLLELKSAGRLRDVDPTVATFSTLGMIDLAAAVVQAAGAAEQRRGRSRGDQAGPRRPAEAEDPREAPWSAAARAGLNLGLGLKAQDMGLGRLDP